MSMRNSRLELQDDRKRRGKSQAIFLFRFRGRRVRLSTPGGRRGEEKKKRRGPDVDGSIAGTTVGYAQGRSGGERKKRNGLSANRTALFTDSQRRRKRQGRERKKEKKRVPPPPPPPPPPPLSLSLADTRGEPERGGRKRRSDCIYHISSSTEYPNQIRLLRPLSGRFHRPSQEGGKEKREKLNLGTSPSLTHRGRRRLRSGR